MGCLRQLNSSQRNDNRFSPATNERNVQMPDIPAWVDMERDTAGATTTSNMAAKATHVTKRRCAVRLNTFSPSSCQSLEQAQAIVAASHKSGWTSRDKVPQ